MNSFEWASQPNGHNRPAKRSKVGRTSYNQNSDTANPDIAEALARKMQKPDNVHGIKDGSVESIGSILPLDYIMQEAERIGQSISDAKDIIRLLPDVGLAANIIVMAICSAGYQTKGISYSSSHDGVLGSVSNKMLDVINEYFTKDFDLKTFVPEWVYQGLISHGSRPILILPEATIDHMINSNVIAGTEDYNNMIGKSQREQWGALGPGNPDLELSPISLKKAGLEHFTTEDIALQYNSLGYRVTDNGDLPKVTALQRKIARNKLTELYASRYSGYRGMVVGNEDDSDKEDSFVTAIRDQQSGKVTLKKDYYADRKYESRPFEVLRHPSTLERKSVGHPSIQYWPHESLIPIVDPTNPEKHAAYWAILDENGNPYRISSMEAYDRGRNNGMVNSQDIPSAMINQVASAMNMDASNLTNSNVQIDYGLARSIFINITWDDLQRRINNGMLGRSYTTSKVNDVFDLMLNIALQKKRCQVLFVPADLMCYFAYNYDDKGIGESLVEMGKQLSSMRLVLMFARANSQWQSAINRRRLDITIDPRDPNIQQSARQIVTNYLINNMQTRMPINCIDPISLNQSIYRQALEVNITSDPRFPNSKLEVTRIEPTESEPDQDFTDELKKLQAMGFSLTPEQIDTTLGDDRVTSRVLNNDLFRERVTLWQTATNVHLSKFVQTFVLNSTPLMDKLREILKSDLDQISQREKGKNVSVDISEYAINWVSGIKVSLPNLEDETPDDTEDKFEAQANFIEDYVDNWIMSDDLFKAGGEFSSMETLAKLRKIVKVEAMRKWLHERGALTDIERIVSQTKDPRDLKNLVEQNVSYMKVLMPIMTEMEESLRAVNDVANDRLPPRGGDAATEAGAYSGNDDDDGGDDGTSDEDFNFDDVDTGFDDPEPDSDPEGGDEGDDSDADADDEVKE